MYAEQVEVEKDLIKTIVLSLAGTAMSDLGPFKN